MRIFLSSMLLFGLITMGNFYCSDSPFDDATNLGSSIIKDKDSLLTVFDGKILNDSVVVKSGHSFIDRTIKDSTDKIISGQHQSTSLAVGSWQNEKAFIYLAFPVDSLNAWAHTLAAGALSPLSLDLLFSSDAIMQYLAMLVTWQKW